MLSAVPLSSPLAGREKGCAEALSASRPFMNRPRGSFLSPFGFIRFPVRPFPLPRCPPAPAARPGDRAGVGAQNLPTALFRLLTDLVGQSSPSSPQLLVADARLVRSNIWRVSLSDRGGGQGDFPSMLASSSSSTSKTPQLSARSRNNLPESAWLRSASNFERRLAWATAR